MLGVFADAKFAEETVRVRAGDGLILFSDGVTEAFNPEGEESTASRGPSGHSLRQRTETAICFWPWG